MKKTTKQKTEEYTVWEAVDGTIFNSEKECKSYEESARGVLRGRLKEFIVNDKYNCWELLGGDEDNTCLAITVPTIEAKDIILQNYYLDQPWIFNSDHEEKVIHAINQAYENNDIVLFGLNCNDELYLIDTKMNIINRLNGLY